MAEPLTAAELSDLRRRSDGRMAGPSYTQADEDRARLLATLDAEKTATFDDEETP